MHPVETAFLYLLTTYCMVRGFQVTVTDHSISGRVRAAIWLAVAFAVMGVPV